MKFKLFLDLIENELYYFVGEKTDAFYVSIKSITFRWITRPQK